MKIIEKETWSRKAHFDFFYSLENPKFDICTTIDVTRFLTFVRKSQLPFYPAMTFCVTKVLNETEAFRLRIRSGQIVLHDRIYPSFTDLDKDGDLFKIVTIEENVDDIAAFCRLAKEKSAEQREYFPPVVFSGRDDMVFISCVPWISFTQVSHPFTPDRNDSVPRVTWGKYEEKGGKFVMPFSLQANHALADGYHASQFVLRLQKFLDKLGQQDFESN